MAIVANRLTFAFQGFVEFGELEYKIGILAAGAGDEALEEAECFIIITIFNDVVE